MTWIVSGSRRQSDVKSKELVVPCIYIFRGKQNHLNRLIIVFAKLKAWSSNFKLAFLNTTLYKDWSHYNV